MKQANRIAVQQPKRVAVFRALYLGDLLCVLPAFRALRKSLPEAEITLIGLPWARVFVDRFSDYLDDFVEFPGFPGFPERTPQIDRIPAFLAEMQSLEYGLALQMQGSGGIANSLVVLFGASLNAGFYLPGQYCPDSEHFLPYPVHEPEIWRHLRLMEFLGLPLSGEDLEFPIYAQDRSDLKRLEESLSLKLSDYACIHPGSRSTDRRWSTQKFAAVGDGLARRGLQVILTGSLEESHLTESVATQMHAPAIDLAGRTTLGTLAALLSRARLLVCNDTGVSHLAAALKIPSVVLFIASDPNRWAPRDQILHRIVSWATAAIPEVVLSEVDELLRQERTYG
jgi:ADP-heptose:LPS heptosyltransferase